MQNTWIVTLVYLSLEIALSTVNIAIFTMYLCPLCKLKTVLEILTNVKHYETMCRKQKKVTLVNLFLELCPFQHSRYWK